MVVFEVLTESLSIRHLVARRNSYQPIPVCIYRNCAIVEALVLRPSHGGLGLAKWDNGGVASFHVM